MKKLFALLLSLIMAFSLAACDDSPRKTAGKDRENSSQSEEKNDKETKKAEAQSEEEPEINAATSVLGFYEKYLKDGDFTLELKNILGSMEHTAKFARSGNMYYVESGMGGLRVSQIVRDGYQYLLYSSTKKCIRSPFVDLSSVEQPVLNEAELELYETPVATGTTDYNGITYDYEEFGVDGATVQYLFRGGELKVIKQSAFGVETVSEIVSVTRSADLSLFEIPSDYTVTDSPLLNNTGNNNN